MRLARSLGLALAVLASALLPLLPTGGAPTTLHAAPQRTPITVGFVSFTALSWPFFIAETLGLFEQEGVVPDASSLGATAQVTAALLGGSLDVGVSASDSHIRAVERGAPTAWFMTEFANPIYGLLVRPNVNSFADLRGQTIVVDAPNGIVYWMTRRQFAAAGMGPDDYNFIFAGGTPDRMAALVAGGVAAASLIQPFDFAAERQGFRRLANSNEVVRTVEFVGHTARRDWLSRNEATLGRYIRGYHAGQRWLYDPANKERAISLLSDRTRLSPEDARATYDLYIERERSFPPGMRINPAGIQAVLDMLVDLGEMTAPTPPPSKFIDTTYLERFAP